MTEAEKKGFRLQDIKTEPISSAQLEEMKSLAGTYDALFSRRALKYRELGLKNRKLTENEIRQLILDEYTFLKRPVVISGRRIFAGSDKKTLQALKKALSPGS
jgi:arsenate reductase (glutaredoxin)